MKRVPRVILLDSNLFLLLLVGTVDRNQIPRFKRTKKFENRDFDGLVKLLRGFDRIAATPNVLTEVSNLAGQLHGPLRNRVFVTLGEISQRLDERYIATRGASRENSFTRLGLTDITIALAAATQTLVLTDDLPLTVELQRLGVPVRNYEHLRSAGWKLYDN